GGSHGAIRGEAAVTTRYPEPAGRQSPKGTNAARDNKNNPTFPGRIVFSDSIRAPAGRKNRRNPQKAGTQSLPAGSAISRTSRGNVRPKIRIRASHDGSRPFPAPL